MRERSLPARTVTQMTGEQAVPEKKYAVPRTSRQPAGWAGSADVAAALACARDEVASLVHDSCANAPRSSRCPRCSALEEAAQAVARVQASCAPWLPDLPGLLDLMTPEQALRWWDMPQAAWNWSTARRMLPVVGAEEVLARARLAAGSR